MKIKKGRIQCDSTSSGCLDERVGVSVGQISGGAPHQSPMTAGRVKTKIGQRKLFKGVALAVPKSKHLD